MIQQTLPRVAHEHHERILVHVDRMPGLGDSILTAPADELRAVATEMSDFLTATLIPHIDAAERTLYPELERLLQNRHSMTPMKREHGDVRRLVADFAGLTGHLETSTIPTGRRLALRRILFQVYALVKIHLAEEDAYLRIVEHGVTSEVGDVLAAALDHPGFRDA